MLDPDASTAWIPVVGRPLAERMVADALAVQRGEAALDLPCGVGALTVSLAGAAGRDGTILAADASPGTRAGCAAALADRSQRWVAVVEPQAVPAGWADVAGSLLTLAHAADPAALLGIAARALRPGGRLTAAVWDAESAVLRAGRSAAEAAELPVAALDAAASLSAPANLAASARSAGLHGAEVASLLEVLRLDSAAHLLAVTAAVYGLEGAVEALDPEARAAAVAAVEHATSADTRADGTLVIPVRLLLLRWRAPGG